MKNSNWENFIKPVVVLFTICLVVSGALAFTNGVTAPIIERNAALAADAARIELLPSATDGFTQMEVDMEGVFEMYRANNGTGYTVTSAAKGYGGDVKWMVAFDTEGTIVGAKVLEQSETAGLGAKVEEAWFQEQFVGKTEELTTSNFDMISGATISSKASMNALNIARNAFLQYGLGVEVGTSGPRVMCVDGAYTAKAEGFGGDITVSITFNEDGTVADVAIKGTDSEDTSPIGIVIPTLKDAILSANSADVDGVAGATWTSNGVLTAAKAIFDAYTNGTAAITVTDGVYSAKAEGFGGDIVVSIAFNEDGSIASVSAKGTDSEDTSPVGVVIPTLTDAIVAANSADIDGVAGATWTSDGVLTAAKAILAAK